MNNKKETKKIKPVSVRVFDKYGNDISMLFAFQVGILVGMLVITLLIFLVF